MKRLLRIFDLSKNEQRVVLIVILALIAGALVRYEWRIHARPVQAAAAAESKVSPSRSALDDER
jgi:phage baseplate assembly protein W